MNCIIYIFIKNIFEIIHNNNKHKLLNIKTGKSIYIANDSLPIFDCYNLLFQFRDIRNQIMHSGQNSVTNDDLVSHIHKLQKMVHLVVPAPLLQVAEHQLIYDNIVKVCNDITLYIYTHY